jgi:hypothetical protein
VSERTSVLEEKEGKEALGRRLLVYDVGGLGRTLEAERRIGGQAMKTSFAATVPFS